MIKRSETLHGDILTMSWQITLASVLVTLPLVPLAAVCSAEEHVPAKKIVFVAGPPSHGYGTHQHYAGCRLLEKCLHEAFPSVETVVHQNGWPQDPKAFDGADAIVVFADGGGANPINVHLEQVETLIKKGVGLVRLHYAVQVDDPRGRTCFKDWIGGYFETHGLVNPTWKAEFRQFPDHPVTRRVKPFVIEDEWYYHMRFRDNPDEATPILSAVPPEQTRQGPDGPYSGNPTVRSRKGIQSRGPATAARRWWAWVRLHRRALALELGPRPVSQGRAQRHRLDGRP